MPAPAITLDVWKELAIHNQMLIRTVTDALGLDPDVEDDALKASLQAGVQRIKDAHDLVKNAEEAHKIAFAEVEAKRQMLIKQHEELEQQHQALNAEKERLEALVEATRKAGQDEVTKLKAELDEKTKALKAINVTLGDTPQNVAKKLKTLNKKKHDETTARKRAEDDYKQAKKARNELDKELKDTTAQVEALSGGYRELQTYCDEQFNQLKELVEDKDSLTLPPKLDEDLLKPVVEAETEAG